MEKKDSIFAGLNSEPPAPSAAPRPAVPEQEVAELKRKMEAMERNIVSSLEKKIGETLKTAAQYEPPSPAPPPPAPKPPDMTAQFLLAKIGELDKRLEEFSRSAMMSSAQMKNIEESKISARREIEDLLKVVREQQKYSELDRQMHDQLEKSWCRVEELEKKLMDFYGTVSKRPAESAAESYKIMEAGLEKRLKPLELALKAITAKIESFAESYKIAEAGLEARLKPLALALKDIAAKIEAAPDASRAVEARVCELSSAVDARLADSASEIRRLHVEVFAGKERVEDIFAEIKKDVLSSVREALAEGSSALIKHVDGVALDERERIDVFSKLVVNHIDGLSALCRSGDSKLAALESCVKSENALTQTEVSGMMDEINKTLRAGIETIISDTRAENARQLEKVKEIYGLSASSLASISAVSGNISAIEERLSGVMAGLKAFVKGFATVNMESILGVSGAMIRKSFESAGELVAELEKETRSLARAKGEIEANIRSINHKLGAGEK